MLYGVSGWLLFFVGTYALLAALAFGTAWKRYKEFQVTRRRKKLKLIQGGKPDKGPYGKSR